MDAKACAERAAATMWAADRASQWMGFTLVSVDAGRAVVAMEVSGHHVNGHDICHGGVIFTLADSAFAFACNSRNAATVAQHNSISYLAPARLGDRLTATAREVALKGRSGMTDVTVTDASGNVIALFRGASRAIGGHVFDEGGTT